MQITFGWMLWLLQTLPAPFVSELRSTSISAQQAAWMPDGGHLGYWSDLWFLAPTNLQPGGVGPIDLFDPLQFSVFGHSWTQTGVRLEGLSLTDPSQFGGVLFDVPSGVWQSLTLQGSWSPTPQLDFGLKPAASQSTLQLIGRGGGAVGGGSWIPKGTFDRTSATDYGAPQQRRALTHGIEGALEVAWAGGDRLGNLWLYGEELAHQHDYLTLSPRENSQRQTVLLDYQLPRLGSLRGHVLLGWQGRLRPYAGAEYRLPQALTLHQTAQSYMASGHFVVSGAQSTTSLQVGMVMRSDWQQAAASPFVIDVIDQWLWQRRAQLGATNHRGRIEVVGEWQWQEKIQAHVEASFSPIWQQTQIANDRIGITSNGVAALQQVYSAWQPIQASWQRLYANIELTPFFAENWRILAELDASAWANYPNQSLSRLVPGFGVLGSWQRWGGVLWLQWRTAPELLTEQVGMFAAQNLPSYQLLSWQDNGDGIPQADETGSVLGRGGGNAHSVSPNWQRSLTHRLSVGLQSPRTWWLQIEAMAEGMVRSNASYVNSSATETSQVPVNDANVTSIWAESPLLNASRQYTLGNRLLGNYHIGMHLLFSRELLHRYFFQLGASSYDSFGIAAMGWAADRNDAGVISEASGGLNNALNRYGHYDSDRSYSYKLQGGGYLWRTLSLGASIRYHDGQPFARMLLVESLPQGPTVVMANPRGATRFTFNMTCDFRLAYTFLWRGMSLAARFDVFNLFGADSELLEDVRTGPTYRQALEAMPGRTVMGSLAMGLGKP